jgi:glyoxylase-like metal-dependent hydrolase (beta-lactamase superfamily II)
MKYYQRLPFPKNIALCALLFFSFGCSDKNRTPVSSLWCEQPTRPALKKLREVKSKSDWFKVYAVGDGVYAIIEPYNYQEVISHLIIGKEKALLFDTGMGLDSISLIVKTLTALPVVVLNSHTHYDHIGGNNEFENVIAMNTDFTKKNATTGYDHNVVKQEVIPEAFCMRHLPKTDTTHYMIRPFKISRFVNDGDTINLGERILKVIAAPGHTPDAIALYDERAGYLWTGDSFYEGPIFLFSEGTDLSAYGKSIEKLSKLAPKLKHIFPAHNTPIANPAELMEAYHAFEEIKTGSKKGKENADGTILFSFDRFSFLIGKKFLASE